jgi:nitric oxide reductase NorE protein
MSLTDSKPAAVRADPAATELPGEDGIWVLVLGDFGAFFIFFMVFLGYRNFRPELIEQSSEHMNQAFGLTNTFLLLTSSWFVALSIRAAQRGGNRATSAWAVAGAALGIVFVLNKFFEYREKVAHGITLNTNDYFTLYYTLTGIHLVHVLIGVIVLLVMARYARTGVIDGTRVRNFQCCGLYWHFVDAIWIVLFALFYMIK